MLGRKIFLELVVKVRPKWRRDEASSSGSGCSARSRWLVASQRPGEMVRA